MKIAWQKDLIKFAAPLVKALQTKKILQDLKCIDHACYRVADTVRYEELKLELSSLGVLLTEAKVNGRPIATYLLNQPVDVAPGISIAMIELPAPKPGSAYFEGFEHIEGVTKESLEWFMERHKNLIFRTDNLNAPINRDVSVKFEEGLVKFHESGLDDVIAAELSQSSSN